MFKKLFLTLLALFFVFSTVGVSFALDKGNKRKGKYTYRKVYKACFEHGAGRIFANGKNGKNSRNNLSP
jgi:hypothetical protein